MQDDPELRKTGRASLPGMHRAADTALTVVGLADQCVKCGLCLPHCPTYGASREEGESPRGRIALARALALGELEAEGRSTEHIDRCLGCRACERVCPPGVRFGELLIQTRSLIAARRGLSPALRRLRPLLSRPALLDAALGLLRLLRLGRLARVAQAWRLAPAASAVPTPPPRSRLPPRPLRPDTSVSLFLGCVARRYDGPVHAAALSLLEAAGHRVAVPTRQACCGAVLAHGGDRDGAATLGDALARSFPGPTPVLVSASGCLTGVSAALPARTRDIHAFLEADPGFAELRFRPCNEPVAVHLPCSLRSHGTAESAVALLGRVPGLRIIRLPEQGRCCGAAGIQFLEQPEQAQALRSDLLADVIASGAASLLTANIGCRLWLQAGLATRASQVRVYHPLQLLARQLDHA